VKAILSINVSLPCFIFSNICFKKNMSAQWINLKLFLPLCHQKCGFVMNSPISSSNPSLHTKVFEIYQNVGFPQVQSILGETSSCYILSYGNFRLFKKVIGFCLYHPIAHHGFSYPQFTLVLVLSKLEDSKTHCLPLFLTSVFNLLFLGAIASFSG